MLYLNGQDINQIIVGIGQEGNIEFLTKTAGPEQFLAAIDRVLNAAGANVNTIEHIFVVVGPGSATALRSVLAIVNTWSFVRDIPVTPIEKLPHQTDREAWVQAQQSEGTKETILPVYNTAPKVSKSTKDSLGRKH